MHQTTANLTITRKNVDINLIIEGMVDIVPANFSGHPDNWSPDESEVEVERILVEATGRELPAGLVLTDREMEKASEALYEAAGQADVFEDPPYDYRLDF